MSQQARSPDKELEELLNKLESIAKKLYYVKTRQIVRPEDHNYLVDFDLTLLEIATRLSASGILPPWAPILDAGKLDFMIVGEPRQIFLGVGVAGPILERKPVYGYLYQDDVRFVIDTLNRALGEERFPELSFGDVLTSDTYNSWWNAIGELAKKFHLPTRIAAVGSDTPVRIVASLKPPTITKPIAIERRPLKRQLRTGANTSRRKVLIVHNMVSTKAVQGNNALLGITVSIEVKS